ncbi:hypothetical protein FACS1894193_02670 [Bacilli bacterium]|nr:hypothetical protein FACS1894192_08700 [Bacilli bacterium]GHU40427.1 hypothetical protein FACS1894193_02670 [Bacilli bacterium]
MDCKDKEKTTRSIASSGIAFGCALAIVISYVKWHSIFGACIHGLFS